LLEHEPDPMPALLTGATPLSALERIYAAFAPCVFGTSLVASYLGGAPANELRARMGRLPPAQRPTIWLHGASAGEMGAAARLVSALREHGVRFGAVFTAANRAGVAYISRSGAPDAVAALAPWDVPTWVSRAFDLWRPAALLLIETEQWPRLIFEAHRRSVPVLALSARIYPGDVARYHAIRAFIAPTLRRLTRVLAQNEVERGRFIALGAAADRCVAAGNLKHLEEHVFRDAEHLRHQLGLEPAEQVIVFGSVHRSEIPLVMSAIAAHGAAGNRFVIAPRHLKSAHAIARAASARGVPTAFRSRGQPRNGWRILILDTMGELRQFYAIASVAVVCGGFGRFGGHNPYEALQAGAPVLFGPHFEHFEHEARALAEITPEARVSNAQQLAARLGQWLSDEHSRRRAVTLQRATLPDAAAVTRRYLDELSPYLGAADA
jgi:3-deoxy-D-manno-octulosonic-acid transferase